MEQVINATSEYLHNQLNEKTERIQQLEEHIQKVTQRDYATAAKLNRIVEEMQAWTMNALEEREISETNAEEISEIVGFDLTKEVEAEVNVTYYITLQLAAGESAEDVINDIDFDAITYDVDKVTHVSSNVDGIDI